MENFIVSARKYRPDTFVSVVGQSSVTNTLKKSIQSNHLAQAYLFCGPRGVGKTTCARIFAKTLNCFSRTSDTEPCNECESCKAFIDQRSYNIHELDAASNNSVEDIRNLIEQVRIPPQVGKYSIYIIDEVHMLSQQAFNAFLKTLEEPPKHAVFILATTEKHKIIPTILSRCQIFDFNRIKIDDTVQFLEHIAIQENIEYEKEAFNIIAQKADGAMRDALSIFDQVVSFSDGAVTYKGVVDNLNILDYEYFFAATDAFLNQDVSKALLIFHEVLDNGFDAHHFLNDLGHHLRDLLVSANEETLPLLEVGEKIQEKYKEQTQRCPATFIFDALEIIGQYDISFRTAKNKRLHVELALMKLCNIRNEKKK
ncbi:MAG: DNA polymerase III subunit gamma/tau [Bacteroidetes bacterium]|jgi:DNA polymerase-3 subunit gamma/tau|nr:DNA polymerase III subunit gamma/tau [Bacteroidota bacterium]